MHEISIQIEPEVFNGKPMYFWCIFGVSGENRYNCGHGWSESIAQAAIDAKDYYDKTLGAIIANGK